MTQENAYEEFCERLEQRILLYFKEITQIGSVTGTEYRVFDWLLRTVFPRIADPQTPQSRKLEVQFTAGNQLLVSWNGASPEKRRMVLVVHTDHEGLVRKGPCFVEGSTLWLHAEDPVGGAIEPWHAGTEVQLAFGSSATCARRRGKVEEIVPGAGPLSDLEVSFESESLSESGESTDPRLLPDSEVSPEHKRPADLARVRIIPEPDEDVDALLARIEAEPWLLGIYPAFDLGSQPDDPSRVSDALSAPFVDNCAGVAVATAVLRAIVDSNVDANVSVLYTTGEEAGFLGLLTMLRKARLPRFLEEAIWIVVDSSSHEGSLQTGMQEWRAKRCRSFNRTSDRVDDSITGTERCPVDVCSIRLEDRCTIFDYSVSLFLYQASMRAKSRLGSSRMRERWRWYKNMGVAGTFVRGECEATVLARYAEIREQFAMDPGLGALRVGSLAIPVVNYRNFSGFDPGTTKPEVTRVGALTSAGFILFEACNILSETYLVEAGPARGREKGAMDAYVRHQFPDRLAELTKEPIDRFAGYLNFAYMSKITKRLEKWVATEGRLLIESLHPKADTLSHEGRVDIPTNPAPRGSPDIARQMASRK